MKTCQFFIVVAGLSLTVSCTKKLNGSNSAETQQLKFIDEYVVPNAMPFKGTIVGGLSGIDRDPKSDLYYIIADDRSDKSPAHFYTAKIFINNNNIDSVKFIDAVTLLDQDGKSYPNRQADPLRTPDPESIRYNQEKNELIWSSEGDRVVNSGTIILVNPAIYSIDIAGRYKAGFELPANVQMQSIEKGPRQNGVFEGTTFSDNYKFLFVSVEEPLYEDGLRAGSGDSSAWVRILKFDTETKKQVAQYAYKIDPVPFAPNPPGGFKVNGISEILYFGNDKLLVMERAFSSGRITNSIRVYLADMAGASDISSVASLLAVPPVKPVTKKLLLNMDDLGRYIDNVEGMTFGPKLTNGHRSLIFVADDNFEFLEQTQFFLFEVLP